MQDRRVNALVEELERANAKLISLGVMLKHASTKHTAQKWRAEALQRKLSVSESELKEAEEKLCASTMDATGKIEGLVL